jgi:hypothetical protein
VRLNPEVPAELERILNKALEKDYELRYQNAAELGSDQKRLRRDTESGRQAASAPVMAARESPTLRRRPRWLAWTAVAGFAVLMAIVALSVFKGQTPLPKITSTTQLTSDGRQKWGLGATDGLRYYFSELADGHWTTAAVSTSGGQAVPIRTPFKDALVLGISPDRSELLVGEGAPIGEMPLWRVPILAGPPRRLGSMLAHYASWSPDGKKIAYANGSALYLAEADGSGPRELVHAGTDPLVWAWGPAWSPDGSRIRFSLFHTIKQVGSLWEITADGKDLHEVLPGWQNPPMHCCGSWTADGRYYLFYSWRGLLGTATDSASDIWTFRENTGMLGKPSRVPIQLTVGPLHFWAGVPSLDGKTLFTTSMQSRGELMR